MNTLFIRADASPKGGTGHVMRCLALGQAWQDRGGNVVFISHCESDALQKRIIDEGFDFIFLDKPHPHPFDIDFTIDTHHKLTTKNKLFNTWFVVDGYHFDSDYQKSIKDAGCKLLWIDDYGHADYYWADLILNQNISANQFMYISREPYTQLLIGTRFALLRREFKHWQNWHREITTIARKVLVTLGGGDSDNITLTIIKAIKNLNVKGLETKIVIGPANPNLDVLKQEISANSNMHLITDASNMPELMAWADIAVAAGGSTCWELAFMGLPQVIICLADNQKRNAEALDREAIGFNLGWHQDVSVEGIASELNRLMMNSEFRSMMSQDGRKLIDGYGGQRIHSVITSPSLRLRPVSSEDCEKIWMWANDPMVRAMSFSKESIPWEEHVRWFHERKIQPFYYVALNQDDLPIGQVRFDQIETEIVISVIIDSEFRNRGYGSALIRAGSEKMFLNSDVIAIHAYVKRDNDASRMAFLRAGFQEISEAHYQGYLSSHFIITKC